MDLIFQTFLENTARDAIELQVRSDVAMLTPLPPLPPSRYSCTFALPYLRRQSSGTVEISPGPVVCALDFPEDYLRSTDPYLFMKLASILSDGFLHPNVSPAGNVCLGVGFAPGTPIAGLVWELFDIVTYRNCTVDERNALNPEACRLVREHPSLIEKLSAPPLVRATHPGPTSARRR
jgi:hypothetical protein